MKDIDLTNITFIIVEVMLPLVLSYFITFILFSFLLNKRINLKMVAQPNANTVTHVLPTPLIGGIGIFIGVMPSILLFLDKNFHLKSYIFGLLPLVFLGLYKDRFQSALSPILQLIFQITASVVLYLHWNEINHLNFNWFNMSIFIAVSCVIINAYNFIDVMDGLAGAYILTVFITLGGVMIYQKDVQHISFVFSFIGGIFAFLKFNWTPAKLFMGDLGSFGLIYSLLFLLISARPSMGIPTILEYLFIFFLVIFEFIFTILKRIMKGKSPLIGDGIHISTILLKNGVKSQAIVTYAIVITLLTNIIAFCIRIL